MFEILLKGDEAYFLKTLTSILDDIKKCTSLLKI